MTRQSMDSRIHSGGWVWLVCGHNPSTQETEAAWAIYSETLSQINKQTKKKFTSEPGACSQMSGMTHSMHLSTWCSSLVPLMLAAEGDTVWERCFCKDSP
jgi:hypothetical protein